MKPARSLASRIRLALLTEPSLPRDLIWYYYAYMLLEAEMSKRTKHECSARGPWSGLSRAEPVVLTQFSTRLPPDLLTRLRVAAPQIGLHQSEIAAIAIDDFLAREGF